MSGRRPDLPDIMFYLVRHAVYPGFGERLLGRASEIVLGEEGRAQARAVARHLGGMEIDTIQAGPSPRTMQTAQVIAQELGIEFNMESALDEIDYGDWTGKRFADLGSDMAWIDWNERRSECRPPQGESMVEAQNRIVAHIEGLRREPGSRRIILVSHCDIIKAALLHYMERPLNAYGAFDIGPASISILRVDPVGAGIVSLNMAPIEGRP